MTREDINDIINAICPNDEDYEKPCISPKYLRQELEQLVLDQRQWNEEPTTKNNLGVDCISRKAAEDITWQDPSYTDPLNILTEVRDKIRELPSVTPQEPQTFKWCTDCREYDQEKHCCHRWSKAIRDTVEEMKQEYIKREVLDEMRVEVEMEKLEDSSNFCVKVNNNAVDRILQILDKYKAETEET